jgi:hypothetical protein
MLVLLAASPTLSTVIRIPKTSQPFSELWIMDANHMAEDYPFNVSVNQPIKIFLGAGNHMGVSSYYLINVKFRNQTQPLPDSNNSQPSPLPSLFELRFLLADGETWENLLNFTLLDAYVSRGNNMVRQISVNGMISNVNCASLNPYFEMFFELWRYDVTTEELQYHNRFVSVWLNITD